MSIGNFLGGIFALIWSPDKQKYLLLKRSSEKDFAQGMWECVTGRVDQGEGFEQALHREIAEEISVQAQFEFVIGTMHFYRGAEKAENELIGLACCCSIEKPDAIQISSEHTEYRWVTIDELDDILGDVKEYTQWLRDMFHRAEVIRRLAPNELLHFYQQSGLELD